VEYNSLNRRIAKIKPDPNHSEKYIHTDFYYTSAWQIAQTRENDNLSDKETLATARKYEYIWDIRYIDAPVCRDENNGKRGHAAFWLTRGLWGECLSAIMPRTARASVGDACYHVLNRGNGPAPCHSDRGTEATEWRNLAVHETATTNGGIPVRPATAGKLRSWQAQPPHPIKRRAQHECRGSHPVFARAPPASPAPFSFRVPRPNVPARPGATACSRTPLVEGLALAALPLLRSFVSPLTFTYGLAYVGKRRKAPPFSGSKTGIGREWRAKARNSALAHLNIFGSGSV